MSPGKGSKDAEHKLAWDFPTFSGLGFTVTGIFLITEPNELKAPRGTYKEGERGMTASRSKPKIS